MKMLKRITTYREGLMSPDSLTILGCVSYTRVIPKRTILMANWVQPYTTQYVYLILVKKKIRLHFLVLFLLFSLRPLFS